MQTPDGDWRVEVYRERGSREQWFRILRGTEIVHDKAPIGVVQFFLGDWYCELEPAEAA